MRLTEYAGKLGENLEKNRPNYHGTEDPSHEPSCLKGIYEQAKNMTVCHTVCKFENSK